MKRILFFSDNVAIMTGLADFARTQPWWSEVDLACSPVSPLTGAEGVEPLKIASSVDRLSRDYRLIVSGHCKQIFPPELVSTTLCVNLHPGFNPETRGWYPQVFSILHGHKIGFTVHMMDGEIDHGPIIFREEVPRYFWDTSRSLYERVLAAEIASIPSWLPGLVNSMFTVVPPEGAGNYFSKQDFRDTCEIDLAQTGTFRDFYDRLRATSFAPFKNAYVRDPETGRKLFIRLEIEPE